MEPSAAETFEAWTTGAVAIVTAVAILIGGAWALWRWVLPGPFAAQLESGVVRCVARQLPSEKYLYIAHIGVTNLSKAVFRADRISVGMYFPGSTQFDRTISEGKSLDHYEGLGELLSDVRFTPRLSRTHFIAVENDPPLDDIVLLVWTIDYRRPRWFGIAGQRADSKIFVEYAPVDAQSLGLYGGGNDD